MEISRRGFVFGSLGLLSELALGRKLSAEDGIVKPTPEEINTLLGYHHSRVLERAVLNGSIKKFDYTSNSTPVDLTAFLKKRFASETVLAYVNIDDLTDKKNTWALDSQNDERLGAGGAISFLYTAISLNGRSNVGFTLIELKDFSGDWKELCHLFNVNRLDFPFIAEFKRNSDGSYRFADLSGCYTKTPETIYKNIELLVKEYTKK